MNKIDTTVRALWISDIHWPKLYVDNWDYYKADLQPFLESFCQKIISNELDYIIITGDLSNIGEDSEYKDFFNKMLEPITKLKKVPIITVPGNHDIDRNTILTNHNLLKDFIENISLDTKLYSKQNNLRHYREEFFEKHYHNFTSAFKPYSSFVKKYLINGETALTYSDSYKENALYGYCLDKKNKIIFILLNTSWYSLGEELLKFFLKENSFKGGNLTVLLKQILNLLKEYITNHPQQIKEKSRIICQIANEYGNQILGLEILKNIDEIINITSKYPEYLTILLMHHPINWLIPDDQIPHDEYLFPKILSNVDLLLTGHEHVLSTQPIKSINNLKTLHLEGGEFMHIPHTSFETGNNWFSFLDFNLTKKTVEQRRIVYNSKDQIWNELESKMHLLHKKHNISFSVERRNFLAKSLKNQSDKFVLKYFKGIKKEENDNLVYFMSEDKEVYFIQLGESIHENVNEILHILNIQTFTVNKIFFVFFDIIHTLADEYSMPNNDRISTLFKIKKDYDLKFDKLRYKFFADLTNEQAMKYSETMFISKIIPFWEIEHFDF